MNEPLPPIAPELIIPLGMYEHYKGGRYEVLGNARHSETLEPMTVYRARYGEQGMWIRPSAMFLEAINVDGVCRKRFQRIDSST